VTAPKRLTLGVIASFIGILGTLTVTGRYVLTPWFVAVASDALADDTRKIAREEASPGLIAVKALLIDKVDELESKKAVLVAQAQRAPAQFTNADAIELASVQARLEKQRAALSKAEVAISR